MAHFAIGRNAKTRLLRRRERDGVGGVRCDSSALPSFVLGLGFTFCIGAHAGRDLNG